jgi:cytochrome c oxidase subunit 2
MYAKVHVVPSDVYHAPQRPWDQWKDSTPEEAAKSGQSLYSQICSSCHTVNGTPSIGPSWKGLFVKQPDGTLVGRQREVIEGGVRKTITVDEDYIIESVHKPEAKKVAEAPYVNNAMTAFPDLDERKIKGLIEYMKTLAE